MAITKRVNRQSGINLATVDAAASESLRYPTRFRIRIPDLNHEKFGGGTALRIVNKSALELRVHFATGLPSSDFEDLRAGATREWTSQEDGRQFHFVDVENLDTSTDVQIGEISYSMNWVAQIPERSA